ncbi:MAG: glycosyltransferase, partial [Bacteroidales bacterium]|nr:glycosyltransferase [Bacteroidales bacterium]
MDNIQLILLIATIPVVAIYLYFIISYTIGWFNLPDSIPNEKPPVTRVSLIIPARNEEDNILNILSDCVVQDYPSDLLEIIVVDD